MQVHLVAVEIGVERRAAALVEAESSMRLDHRIEGHDAELVKAGLAIEQDDVVVDQVSLHYVTVLEPIMKCKNVCLLHQSAESRFSL